MIVILEGCDRCGKTTLCEQLQHDFPEWLHVKHVKPPSGVRSYDYFMESVKSIGSRNAIIDRFFWSGLVYERVFHNQIALSITEQAFLEHWCMSVNAFTVYLEDSASAIRKRWTAEETAKDGSDVNIETIQSNYERVIRETKLPVVRGNLTDFMMPDGTLHDRYLELHKVMSQEALLRCHV